MDTATSELARATAAWVASLAFAITFLAAWALGASVLTGAVRGAVVAVATLVAANLLVRPVLSVVLNAMARDRAARQQEQERKEPLA